MSQYFGVVEIVKPFPLDVSEFTFYAPFVVFSQVTTNSTFASTSYFTTTFGAADETNKEVLNIKSIIRDLVNNYSQQDTLADCLSNETSFYFDTTDQLLYIHVEHDVNFFAADWHFGKVFGFTTDEVRQFNGIDYLPEVISIPNLKREVDPIYISKASLWGGDIVMRNDQVVGGSTIGIFDGETGLNGQQVDILFGQDGDDYTDLIGVSRNFIENIELNLSEARLITKDMREKESIKIPTEKFSLSDYPDMDPDRDGKIKPMAWGYVRGVKGFCTNDLEGALAAKVFYFSPFTTITVYKKVDDLWVAVVPTASDATAGTKTLAVADAHIDGDGTKGLNEIMAIGTFINYSNPADIISDINNRYLSITYNSSNYNTTEWAAEKAYLADTGLYLEDARDIWDVIEQIQNSSTVGFFYWIDYNKRTIRINNPNRIEVDSIEAVELLNNGILPVNLNSDQFATHAVIKYNQHYAKGEWLNIENRDYYNEAFAKFWREKQYPTDQEDQDSGLETGLVNESDAEDKGTIIMDDLSDVRPIFNLLVQDKDFFNLRIFDIINAEISFPGIKIGDEYSEEDLIVDEIVAGEEEIIYTDDDTEEDIEIIVDWSHRDIVKSYREFFGWQRLQIIGLNPDFKNGYMEIIGRQRDYSDAWDIIFP